MNTPSSSTGSPDWGKVKIEAEQKRLREENRDLKEENERLKGALVDRGIDLNDELGSSNAATEEPHPLHPLVDEHPLDGCEPIPSESFDALPAPLHEAATFWSSDEKRDVFLTASLGVLSGCMPNVCGYWGADVPSRVRPNLYAAFVAGAAGGKSAGSFAKRLTSKVAAQIKKEADEEYADWRERRSDAEGDFTEPEPPEKRLYVPANVSSAYLMETISSQDGRALVFSSEIDTMADAMGQDWGKFDSFLRKAYHHEGDAVGRRGDGRIEISDPSVSLVLGGTADQFTKLVGSTENGLYSRLCLYYFEAAAPWQDQKPTREGIERLERFEGMANRIFDVWRDLRGRTDPLRITIEDDHWRQIRDAFQPLHRDVQEMGFPHLISIPRRAGLWAYRIMMVLAVLRAHSEGAKLRRIDTLTPARDDVWPALQIAWTYAYHSLSFARAKLRADGAQSPRDERIAAMLAAVPDRFSSSEAYAAAQAAAFDVSTRTLRRDLQAAKKRGLIYSRGKRSGWKKSDG